MQTTNKLLYEDLSYEIIGSAREVYKELSHDYNVEKNILIIQCNSVKICGELPYFNYTRRDLPQNTYKPDFSARHAIVMFICDASLTA